MCLCICNLSFLYRSIDRYAFSIIGQSIPEYIDDHLEELTSLKPREGIIYLLVADELVTGMGALRKLIGRIVEIKRMYIRPTFRGRGYGK